MGSREKDQNAPHPPLLSSLVVRPSESAGGGGAGSDYEPGEVRRDPPPYSRSDHGYRMRAGSVSPVRRSSRYSPDFNHSGGPPRSRGFGNGRDPGRYRDYSPPYGRGRGVGRFTGRGHDGPGSLRGEGMPRNNPNVRPREGDWICADPLCKNLNFARREYCNNCNRPRYAPAGSPRRGYPGPPPPPPPPRRFPGPPMTRSPGRAVNGGYRTSPRGWARDASRDYRAGGPPPRHEGRFPDPHMHRGRQDYPEDDYRDRYRFDRQVPLDWSHRDRGRENYLHERKGYERRPLSPAPGPGLGPGGQWDRDIRVRSRSPVRGGVPPKDYHRGVYMDRRRDERRGVGPNAF